MSEKQAQPARSDKDEQAKSEKDKQGRSDKEKQARSEKDMFYRSRMFPDVRSALKYQQKSIEQIKTTCLVGTDANVLLMPYQIDKVSLDEIVRVYNSLNKEKRLIIPAQAAREFLSHRAEKVGNVVQHLRDEASRLVGPLRKKIGIFSDDAHFTEAKNMAAQLVELTNKLQSKLNGIADDLSLQIGRDPVSNAYAGLLDAVRDLELDDPKKKEFQRELEWRYSNKIPPGYMDAANAAGGAGDLLIWKTLLQEGKTQQKDLIFVTGEEKADWWVRNHGAFQPRVELIVEYRAFTGGYTVHIMPLSKFLRLFDVKGETLQAVKKVETANVVAAAISSAPTQVEHYSRAELAATRAELVQEADQKMEEIQNWEAGMGWLPQDQRPPALLKLRERWRNLQAQIRWIDGQLTLTPPLPDDV